MQPATTVSYVPVPHEGWKPLHWLPGVLTMPEFPFPMRGWKSVQGVRGNVQYEVPVPHRSRDILPANT